MRLLSHDSPALRYLPALAVMILGLALSFVAFRQAREHAEAAYRAEIEEAADFSADLLRDHLAARQIVPMSLAALLSFDRHLDADDLAAFADSVFNLYPSLMAIGWSPGAPGLPSTATIIGRDGSTLRDRKAAGIPAPRPAADALPDSGTAGLGTIRSMAAGTPEAPTTILYAPIPAGGAPASQPDFALAEYRLDRLVTDAFDHHTPELFRIHVFDTGDASQSRWLHTVRAVEDPAQAGAPGEELLGRAGLTRRTIRWGEQEWLLLFEPVAALDTALTGRAEFRLALGVLLTASFSGYFAMLAHSNRRLRREIDARRVIEAHLARSNAEKDLLMKEVNHRVKNSLQMVSSLLSLQGQAAGSEPATRQFEDARARVQAIAQLHESLYRNDQVTAVEFGSYLGELCNDLAAAAPYPDLTCRVEAAAVQLPTDKAVTLGLLAVELVTNAIKHGGAAAPRCVEVTFGPDPQGGHALSVRDHGPGLPAGFDPYARRSNSLGMTLVVSLARRLGGHLEAANADPGARWTVRLPADPKAA